MAQKAAPTAGRAGMTQVEVSVTPKQAPDQTYFNFRSTHAGWKLSVRKIGAES